MCNNNHCHTSVGQLTHDIQHLVHQLRIERARNFVKKHRFRMHGQGPRNGDSLLLATRKLLRILIGLFGQPYLLQEVPGYLLGLLSCKTLHMNRRFHYVLERGEVWKQVEVLKHHTYFFTHRHDPLGGILLQTPVDLIAIGKFSLYEDATALRYLQVVDAAQQG